jgi:hypothetical protein
LEAPVDIASRVPMWARLAGLLARIWAERIWRVVIVSVVSASLAWACRFAPEGAPRWVCLMIAALLEKLGGTS